MHFINGKCDCDHDCIVYITVETGAPTTQYDWIVHYVSVWYFRVFFFLLFSFLLFHFNIIFQSFRLLSGANITPKSVYRCNRILIWNACNVSFELSLRLALAGENDYYQCFFSTSFFVRFFFLFLRIFLCKNVEFFGLVNRKRKWIEFM